MVRKMKKQLSNFLKLPALMVGICLLTVSCENETIEIDNQILIENGTNPFIKKGNIGDFQEINSYVSRLKNQNSLYRTESDESSNNFEVIEDSEIYVYTDTTGITTYTIPILRENQVSYTFSNLILKTIDDNQVDAFILNYTPTEDYLNAYIDYNQTPYQGLIQHESIFSEESQRTNQLARDSCSYITFDYCNWGGTTHSAGANCTPEYMWSVTISICSGGGESGGYDYGSDAPTDDNPSGGGGGSGDGGTNTAPVLGGCLETNTCEYDDELVIVECLGNVEGLDILRRKDKAKIANFINTNGCVENIEFVEEVIEALIDGDEVDFEEKIINGLEGKALCVYNKLKSSSTGFKNAIKKFEPEFPVAHLKFKGGDLNDNTRGQTSPPNNYLITITLNNDTSNSGYDYRPNLLTAKTIIHEVIHAEMFRKLLELSNDNGSIDVSTLNTMLANGDYPGMLDYYTRYGLNGFQHQQMATHYRETIGRVLQEYDTGNTIPDNQQPDQLYMDLAWEGLNHSNIVEWQELTTQEEKDRIDQEIADYISEHANENCN